MAWRQDGSRDATSVNRWLRRESETAKRGGRGRDRPTERGRERESKREGEKKNLDQAEKGLKFTLGNAVSRTGKNLNKKETQK